jgi:hypothetical protein
MYGARPTRSDCRRTSCGVSCSGRQDWKILIDGHRAKYLHEDGLLPLDQGRGGRKRPANLVVPEHAPEAVGARCPPARKQYLTRRAARCPRRKHGCGTRPGNAPQCDGAGTPVPPELHQPEREGGRGAGRHRGPHHGSQALAGAAQRLLRAVLLLPGGPGQKPRDLGRRLPHERRDSSGA